MQQRVRDVQAQALMEIPVDFYAHSNSSINAFGQKLPRRRNISEFTSDWSPPESFTPSFTGLKGLEASTLDLGTRLTTASHINEAT